jgi:outer membrane receptor protein involved in Fe transport
VDIRPQRIPTLLLALRSFGFVVRNRAERISLFTNVLTDPRYGEIITRHPSASEVQAACGESAIEATNTLGCITAPIGAIIDGRLRNRETVWTSGVDVAAQYQWAVPMGAMTARLDGTYVFDYSRASDWNAPRESLLDTPGNPLSRRLRGTLEFSRNRFQAGLSLNFSNAYDDNVSLPTRRVSSSMTYDANFSYVTAGGGRFTLSVTNLTDKNPPFVNNPLGIGYDQENGDLQGRVIHATAGVNW